jgi:hypothetical protein
VSSPPATLPAATEPRERDRTDGSGAGRGRFALDWSRLAPVLVAAAIAVVYLIVKPRTVDLAAHVFRAELFEREGFVIWNGTWYGGHHALAYSVLFPPLAWLIGPLPLGALSSVVSAGLFERIAHFRWGERARWGALWFGAGTGTLLFTGRLPFGLGVTFALAAVLAYQRRRDALACVLAVGCSITSPVAGLFLAMAGAVLFLAGERRRGAIFAIATIAPALAIAYAFPEGAHEPFDLSTFWPLPVLMAACFVVLPRDERVLRVGAVVYALSGIAAYVITTSMGGNAVRLGALFGGPLLACALAGRMPAGRWRLMALGLLFASLAFWQWSPAVRDTKKGIEDPSTQAAYYQPLLGELKRRGVMNTRIEIPFTRSHWESAEVAPLYPLARGWERQLDIPRNGIFYDGGVLNRLTYGTWLAEHAVGWVAVASVKPDYSGYRERALVESGLPYLKLRWRSKDWRLYEVTLPHAIVVPDGSARMSLVRLGNSDLVLDVQRPGTAAVKVQWSPYWRARGGCVERDGEWTRVIADRPGRLRLAIEFSPERIFAHGRRCG